MFRIIAALIDNAAPSSDPFVRRKRYAHGLRLWATLLKFIPAQGGSAIEQLSLRWPIALRRRFVSALYHRTRKRWPYPPYRPHFAKPTAARSEIAAVYDLAAPPTIARSKIADFCPGFKYSTARSVRDLSAVNAPSDPKSGI
jgi:hypothetical protein